MTIWICWTCYIRKAMKFSHIPVMLNECMEGLNLKDNGVYFDCTLGYSQHTTEILKRTKNSIVYATDLDLLAIENAKTVQSEFPGRLITIHDNFKNFKRIAENLSIDKFDGILVDLGVSSMQLDMRERGFSYLADSEKLDMRMNEEQSFSALDVVNGYSREKLIYILKMYGEEKFAVQIVQNILKFRESKRLETCGELVRIIESSIPKKFQTGGHPAKRTFQAIRIEVNGELEGLDEALRDMVAKLKVGGRLAVLTFHSLEDRIVKNTFRDLNLDCVCDKSLPVCVCGRRKQVELVNRKPIIATSEEQSFNTRSKSAKLRVVEKL